MKLLAWLFRRNPPAAPPAPPPPRPRVFSQRVVRYFSTPPEIRNDSLGAMTHGEFLEWLRERRGEYLKPRKKA